MRARSRLGLLVALAVVSFRPAAADDVSFIPADGSSGWSTAIPTALQTAGGPAPALSAPLWFARLPDTKISLAPEGSFALASARGKVLLIDFWASWCGPCLQELPHLQKLHAARAADGLIALAVNADEPAAAAAEAAKRLGLTMTIGVNDPELYTTLGVRTLPTLLVVDKEGRLRRRWDGYRLGLEKEIAATVDQLLAGDATGTTRDVAAVVEGNGRLVARWTRDLPGSADGVVGLPPGASGKMRVVASGGDELLSFDAAGEAIARLKAGKGSGRLLDFGAAADGTRELLAFRPGATSVAVVELRSGDQRTIALPAPLLDLALTGEAAGPGRRLTFATPLGAAGAAAGDQRAVLQEGAAVVRSVAAAPDRRVVAVDAEGSIAALGGKAQAGAPRLAKGSRLLGTRAGGAIAGPQAVVAAVSGRFLAEGERQIAIATYSGRLTLIDEASGKVVFDAVWNGVHDLAATDLDGDGRDELLVASGRSVTALSAPKR